MDISAKAFRVEPARSGRVSCRKCGEATAKNEIRIGEPSAFQDHVSHGWYHLNCFLELLRGKVASELDGFNDLNEEGWQTVVIAMQSSG